MYKRQIYDSVAAVVDEVIGQFLQKPYFREPYYAEYCDGKIAQCPGMKQWGTLDLDVYKRQAVKRKN